MMSLTDIIVAEWRRICRQWRAGIGLRLVPVALLPLIMLGLIEPLLCVLHCELMGAMPAGYTTSIGSNMAMTPHSHSHGGLNTTTTGAGATIAMSDSALCPAMLAAPAAPGAPDNTTVLLAQPFHEVAPPAIALLLPVALLAAWWRAALPGPHCIFLKRLLPPPRFQLA